MIQVRKSDERGHADHGWLKSHHTFSFADYYEPEFMGFRDLRVINDDFISGGRGFPTHPHKDMEIITYVIEGALEHRDTLGTQSVIRPGEVQRMSAGTGIQHSEFNSLPDKTTHLLQIWILPDKKNHTPGYEQKSFAEQLKKNTLLLVASPTGRDGTVSLHQDVDLYAAKWSQPTEQKFTFRGDNRYGWVQVVSGEVSVGGTQLKTGDGLAISGEKGLQFSASKPVEFLFFDLP